MIFFDHFLNIILLRKNINLCAIYKIDYLLTNDFNIYILEINNFSSSKYFHNDMCVNFKLLNNINPINFMIEIMHDIFFVNNLKNDNILKKYDYELIYKM